MTKNSPRLAGLLAGDIHNQPDAKIKYGLFFEALARQFTLGDIYDASLYGMKRYWNAAKVFHPNLNTWRNRYMQNIPAFRSRSRLASARIHSLGEKVDAIIQVNLLFDSNWKASKVPKFIYTDYTATLSSRRPEAGRSPFSPHQFKEYFRLEKRAYAQATHIFTRGKFVRESLILDYDISPDKVKAVGGGVNFASLPKSTKENTENTPIMLFIGRDFYRKGGDLLLHAFAEARKEYPKAKLLLMTRDAVAEDLPLEGVELLPSAWDREKLKGYFRQANLFILPSRLETWGDVLLEAMAYSLPCIGVNEGAIPEIIKNNETGILVESENIEALSAAMKTLFGNTALRNQYGRAARQRIEDFFTWDHVIQLMKPDILKATTHF
ncbi:MAG: hypothetical protein DRI32_00185 [Chloroflexi bacterium]|nr:MAG: hypothetical protein DRI32_00185 [Chloroflexota bacterium]